MNDIPSRSIAPLEDAAPETEKPRSWLSFTLAGLLALQVFVALFLLLMQVAVALAVAVAFILLAGALHYWVWGRWLGETIRKEVEEEEHRQSSEKHSFP